MLDPAFLTALFQQFAMKNPGVIGNFDFSKMGAGAATPAGAMMGYTPMPGAGLPPLPRPAMPSIGQLAQPVAAPVERGGIYKGGGGGAGGKNSERGKVSGGFGAKSGGFGGFT